MSKKALVALAASAALGVAFAAENAPSSVTLYGIADAYLGSKKTATFGTDLPQTALTATSTNNGVVNSGGLQGSRFGMRIHEDLGAGMRAYANLEAGFNIDNGSTTTTNLLFARQANVGFGGSFGSVQLGRNYSPYYNAHAGYVFGNVQGESVFDASGSNSPLSATNASAVKAALLPVAPATASMPALAAALNNAEYGKRLGAWMGYNRRLDNSIRYDSPDFGNGFKFAVAYGFGEDKASAVGTTAAVGATRAMGLGLSYANGPLALALAYQDELLVKGVATTPDFHVKNTMIGGSYDLKAVRLSAAYNVAKYTGLANQKEWLLGVSVPMTSATTLNAQYARSKGDFWGKNTSVGLEVLYALSKRTTAYVGYNDTKLWDLAKTNVFGVGVRHVF